jgi:hypothetical protein
VDEANLQILLGQRSEKSAAIDSRIEKCTVTVDADSESEEEEEAEDTMEDVIDDYLLFYPDAKPEELPNLISVPKGRELEQCQALWATVATQFTLRQLPQLPYLDFGISAQFAADMVGQSIWEGFYGTERLVTDSDTVPLALLEILNMAVQKTSRAFAEMELKTPESQQSAKDRIAANKAKKDKAIGASAAATSSKSASAAASKGRRPAARVAKSALKH